jgi:hypothetical protein
MHEGKTLSLSFGIFAGLTATSIFFGLIIITANALKWILVEAFTPFLMGPFLWMLMSILALLVITSVIFFFFQIRNNIRFATIPLLINITTLLIIWFVPFTSIWLDIEFRLNLNGYNEVIQLVENGELQCQYVTGHVELPTKYRHLSRGGDIIIDKSDGATSVFFYTYRGVLDNFSGYMYRSNDTPPTPGAGFGDWFQVTQQQPHWYFCASR